jgi:hypothetical protein
MGESASTSDLRALASSLVNELSKVEIIQGRAYVRTAIALPSGAMVAAVVEETGRGHFLVTDGRQGWEEADLLQIAPSYVRQARELAEAFGVQFVSGAVLISGVSRGQLAAAIMAVANSVSRALERAIARAPRRADDYAVERLVSRLRTAFPHAAISSSATLLGASTHQWTFDAIVRREESLAAFDIVAPHPISIAFAAAKFHDLVARDDAPRGVAVVQHKADLGDLIAVVSQAASVIEESASDATFRQAAHLQAA